MVGQITTSLRYASFEAKFGWPEEAWKSLVAGAPASWKLYREKFQLEGHETLQMLGAYLGRRQVFSDYSRFSAPETPTTSILTYSAKVSAALGTTVIPPQKLLQKVVEELGRYSSPKDNVGCLFALKHLPTPATRTVNLNCGLELWTPRVRYDRLAKVAVRMTACKLVSCAGEGQAGRRRSFCQTFQYFYRR